jgi:hypothetical protein
VCVTQDDEEELDEEGGEGAEAKAEDLEDMLSGGNANMAKDEVARLIRGGVTALFEGSGKDVTDDEIDVLLGEEGGVDGGRLRMHAGWLGDAYRRPAVYSSLGPWMDHREMLHRPGSGILVIGDLAVCTHESPRHVVARRSQGG